MPTYVINIQTDAVLDQKGLESLEDVVYDEVVDNFGGSTETDVEGIGLTDVHATFN